MSAYTINTYEDERVVEIRYGRTGLCLTAEEALELSEQLAQTAIKFARLIVTDELLTAQTVHEETEALAAKHGTTVEALKAAADCDEEEA